MDGDIHIIDAFTTSLLALDLARASCIQVVMHFIGVVAEALGLEPYIFTGKFLGVVPGGI